MTDNLENYNELQKLVHNSYESAKWTHKINEKQAELLSTVNNRVTITEIIFIAFTFGGIAAWLSNMEKPCIKIASLLLSSLSFAITLVGKFYNLDNKTHEYKRYAEKFLEQRNIFELFEFKVKTQQASIKELTSEYEKLQDNYSALCKDAPLTGKKALKRAEKEFAKDSTSSTARE